MVKPLTKAQIRELTFITDGAKMHASNNYRTLEILIERGLVVQATDIYMIDGSWTERFVPSIDAKKVLGR